MEDSPPAENPSVTAALPTPQAPSPSAPDETRPPTSTGTKQLIIPASLFYEREWEYFRVPKWLMFRPKTDISFKAKILYSLLANHAGKSGECFPSQRTLARELDLPLRVLQDYLNELKQLGLVEVKRPGLQKPNRYFFYDHPWMHEMPQPGPDPASDTLPTAHPDTLPTAHPDTLPTAHPDTLPTAQSDALPTAPQDTLPTAHQLTVEKNHIKKTSSTPISPLEGGSVTNPVVSNPAGGDNREIPVSIDSQAEITYAAYPKKVGKPSAKRAIQKALAKYPFDLLLKQTRLYTKTYDGEPRYIPNPSTWFNQERFNDDPTTWRHGNQNPHARRPDAPPRQFEPKNYEQSVEEF
jgi:hypothetical protein